MPTIGESTERSLSGDYEIGQRIWESLASGFNALAQNQRQPYHRAKVDGRWQSAPRFVLTHSAARLHAKAVAAFRALKVYKQNPIPAMDFWNEELEAGCLDDAMTSEYRLVKSYAKVQNLIPAWQIACFTPGQKAFLDSFLSNPWMPTSESKTWSYECEKERRKWLRQSFRPRTRAEQVAFELQQRTRNPNYHDVIYAIDNGLIFDAATGRYYDEYEWNWWEGSPRFEEWRDTYAETHGVYFGRDGKPFPKVA